MLWKFWWLLPDSNWGHKALQASALPTELKSRNRGILRDYICLFKLRANYLFFFSQEILYIFYGTHKLGREDNSAILLAGYFGKGL
jgi:hypothetical protein